MAVYRKIETSFWQDPFILELDSVEKYFYLYLMTNTKTNQCGIYEISKTVMQMELGLDKDTINELIQKFVDYKKIIYSEETHEVMILNWIKYNGSSSPKVLKRVETELKSIKDITLIKRYIDLCKEENYPIDTLSILYTYSIDTQSQKEKEEEETKEETKEEEAETCSSNFSEIGTLYQQVIGQPNGLTPQWIEAVLEEYGFNWVKIAMLEAEKRGKRTKKYVEGILQNWKRDGGIKLGNEQLRAPTKTFDNFTKRKYDPEELKEMLLAKSRGDT